MEQVYEEEAENDEAIEKAARAPRFLEKWLEIFHPWVTRSKSDPNRPFCKACRTSLDCNRAHLQRHAGTTKHERNLKILVEKGEQAALDNFLMSRERNKYYFQRKMRLVDSNESIESNAAEGEYITGDELENETSFEYVKMNTTRYSEEQLDEKPIPKQQAYKYETTAKITNSNRMIMKRTPTTAAASRNERIKLFMQIQKDKNDLMKTFRDLISVNTEQNQPTPPALPPPAQTPPKTSQEKNHVDLFFESVSSSVKALSPKLVAEAKMRVQQLICELELRELTEGDKAHNSSSNVAVTVSNADNTCGYQVQSNEKH